jgi:hypothetical protein
MVTSQHAGPRASARAGTLPRRSSTDPARLAAAAAALGWAGLVLPGVRLLGTRIAPVLAVDATAHDHRRRAGCAVPMSDVDTLAVWEWPQAREACPPPVVGLLGVLVPAGRSWAAATAIARRWAGFGATAIVLPTDAASELCRLECGYAGIAITGAVRDGRRSTDTTDTGDSTGRSGSSGAAGRAGTGADADGAMVRLLQPGRPGRSERARRRTLDRWVEEQLYGRLLTAGVLAT